MENKTWDKRSILRALDDMGMPYTIHGDCYVVVDVSGDDDQLMVDFFPVEITVDCGVRLQRKMLVSLIGDFKDEEDVASSLAYCGEYAGQ